MSQPESPPDGGERMTQAVAAATMQTSVRSIQRMARLQRERPDIVEAVARGEKVVMRPGVRFGSALAAMRDGKFMRRRPWRQDIVAGWVDGDLRVACMNGQPSLISIPLEELGSGVRFHGRVFFGSADLNGDDWQVLE